MTDYYVTVLEEDGSPIILALATRLSYAIALKVYAFYCETSPKWAVVFLTKYSYYGQEDWYEKGQEVDHTVVTE